MKEVALSNLEALEVMHPIREALNKMEGIKIYKDRIKGHISHGSVFVISETVL